MMHRVGCGEELRVGGEGSLEGLKLGGDGVSSLVGFVLKHGDLAIAVQLDVAVVSRGQLGDEHLEAGAVGVLKLCGHGN